MTKLQLEATACWDDVRVKSFDWSMYPKHTRNLYVNVHPFLVIHHALSLYEVSSVLYIDPYREIRRPWALEPIKRAVATEGFWFAETGRSDASSLFKSDDTYFSMLLDANTAKSLCDIGFGGMLKESEFYKYLNHEFLAHLKAASVPDLASAALTLLLHATGRTCAGNRAEWSVTDAGRITEVGTNFVEDVSVFTHVDGSGLDPSPYKPYLKFIRSQMSKSCPIVSTYQRAELEYPVDVGYLEKQYNDHFVVVNHPFVDHSELFSCLASSHTADGCRETIKRHHQLVIKYYQSEFRSLP
jgi:hypothetical protein